MDKNRVVEETNELYRLTLLFPKKEPLRFKMRKLADEILANFVTHFNPGFEPVNSGLIEDSSNLFEVLDSFFEVAKKQNWVKPSDLLNLQQKYRNIKQALPNFAEQNLGGQALPNFAEQNLGGQALPSLLEQNLGGQALPSPVCKCGQDLEEQARPNFAEENLGGQALPSLLEENLGGQVLEEEIIETESAPIQLTQGISNIPLPEPLVIPKPSVMEESNIEVSERQRIILDILKQKEGVQVWEVKDILPDISKRTLRRDFKKLLNDGLVERKGDKNTTFYQLKGDRTD